MAREKGKQVFPLNYRHFLETEIWGAASSSEDVNYIVINSCLGAQLLLEVCSKCILKAATKLGQVG